MPNWAKGILKLRGSKEDIRKFLTEGLKPIHSVNPQILKLMGREVEEPEVTIQEDDWDFRMFSPNGLHIVGSQRAFFEHPIEWYFDDEDEIQVLSIDSFAQAWDVDAETFVKISSQYNLDIKINAFERGMQFNREIEIHKGELIKNEDITFKDYKWECLMPDLGG